jgi:hypothetical protein
VPPRLAVLPLLALLLGGCSDDPPERPAAQHAPGSRTNAKPAPKPARRVKPLRCPAGAANCRAAIGRVIYVEAVDPDGDGDLHVVLASREQITGPGITVVDVERALRPRHVPRVGDTVAAEGPVYRGSHGQRQIEADRVRFSRR